MHISHYWPFVRESIGHQSIPPQKDFYMELVLYGTFFLFCLYEHTVNKKHSAKDLRLRKTNMMLL